MTEKEFVQFIGPLAQADMKKSGVLASVTAAQAILESGYGSTDLAKNANNYFGMKCNLSGKSWAGSAWDGVSKYTKITKEDDGHGNLHDEPADFRKYPSIAESIADHSAYLLNAMNGSKKRYAGLKGERDPKKAITIIKNGGYATDTKYVSKILNIIERFNLTQFDAIQEGGSEMSINIIKRTGNHGLYNAGSVKKKYLVIHYTAGVTSKKGAARNTADWFANPAAGGTADYIVDDAEIVQYNPDPEKYSCWAVGGKAYGNKGGKLHGIATNMNCVSIEICSNNKTGKPTDPNDNNWYFTDAELENAAELAKYLMKKFNIPLDRVIRHYDVTGKWCPGIKGWNLEGGSDEKTWLAFKKKLTGEAPAEPEKPAQEKKYYRVRKNWLDAKSQIGAYEVLDNAKANCPEGYTVYDWNGNAVYSSVEHEKVPYMVRVEIDDLNIRTGPGTNYTKTGSVTGVGNFTIVEVKAGKGSTAGWGRLKSGAGWISLDYAVKMA